MPAVQETIEQVRALDVDKYKYGFTTNIESDLAPKGLDESTVRFISAKKGEPEWMTEWRLPALRPRFSIRAPTRGRGASTKIDYQGLPHYAAPQRTAGPSRLRWGVPPIFATY